MPISFNSLPTSKPSALIPNGSYYATIETAEIKQGSDITKPPYLSMCLALKDQYGKSCGKIYDILSESDKELVRFKLARFIIATGLTSLTQFELADLVKIIKGKQIIVDIKQEEATERFPAKNVVDVFKGNIYYPMSEANVIFGAEQAIEKQLTNDIPFAGPYENVPVINAADAADVHPTEADVNDMF